MLKYPTRRSKEAIHLLRALFRQASCLFDDHTRNYIKGHIIARFRDNLAVVSEQRQSQLLKDARKALSSLQRANDGHQWRMQKLMEMAYGRIGKRRHELLKPILDIPPGAPFIPGNPRSAPPGTSLLLQALIGSSRGRYFKKAEPTIPDKNSYGRPFPVVRKANILWRYRSYVVEHLQPPIQSQELLRLERLASGKRLPIPSKRKKVRQMSSYRNNAYPEKRTITRRYQRRMYQKVLRNVPFAEWQKDKAKWVMHWRSGKLSTIGEATNPEDFEGVNEDGKLAVQLEPSRMSS